MARGLYKVFRTREEYYRDTKWYQAFARQQMMDAICLALHEEFEFGESRFKRFMEAYNKAWSEIVVLCNEDVKDDKEMVYSKNTIDKALRQAVGEANFVPWEQRYNIPY